VSDVQRADSGRRAELAAMFGGGPGHPHSERSGDGSFIRELQSAAG